MTSKIFGYSLEELKDKKAEFTAAEIRQQPATWKKTFDQIEGIRSEADAFIAGVTGCDDYDIILTGAGTSEYVGNTLYPAVLQKHRGHVHSIGTTDIVASPRTYISADRPTLLISFARSGSSPESVGAVQAAEAISDKVRHLFITCNKDGHLAKLADEKDNCFKIVLTEETHDQSFVMTSSFTNMYIAALMLLMGEDISLSGAAAGAEEFLDKGYAGLCGFLEGISFSRIVYLGSDVLKGIAQESALKMMEITAGDVVAIYDTPMGFRHGPKSVVNEDTLTVVYLSDDPYTRRYEMDLLAELDRDRKGSHIIAVSSRPDPQASELADFTVVLQCGGGVSNAQLAPAYVTVAQTLALLYSIKTGHTPDNPCPTGEVNRVVKGVTIYEVEK